MNTVNRDRNGVDILGRVLTKPTLDGGYMRFAVRQELRIEGEIVSNETTIETKDPRLMQTMSNIRIGDCVSIKGVISVSQNVLAIDITNLGILDKNETEVIGTVKGEPTSSGEEVIITLVTKEPVKERVFRTEHTIVASTADRRRLMLLLREGDKVLVQGVFSDKRIIAHKILPLQRV